MNSEKRIYLSAPHMNGHERILVEEAFRSNWIAPTGPMVDRFEAEVAEFTGAKAALATSSGTAALHLALMLCGVGSGDTVFCSSFTFAGSVNPILYLNARPVFIDSEPESWNMSPMALRKAFDDAVRTGAMPKTVIVVNLYGQNARYQEIQAICDEYGIPIIEDAAESLGATYRGNASGTMGRFGIFSFNGNKIITTSGGGMLISSDADAIDKARYLATQAREPVPWYEHREVGFNYRLSNILAAIGCGQFSELHWYLEQKRKTNQYYKQRLCGWEGIGFMPEISESQSNCWLSVITLNPDVIPKSPVEVVTEMEEANIETRLVWKPMHLQPVFNEYLYYTHYKDRSFCDTCFKQGLCLPSGCGLTVKDLDRVVEALSEVLFKFG